MLPAFDTSRRMPSVDLTLLWSGLILLLLGMVMVYSASIAIAEAGRTPLATIRLISWFDLASFWPSA